MTVKEAILKSLDDIKSPVTHNDVYKHMTKNNYYKFTNNKTPSNYVSAVLGNFIRDKDKRVKRVYDKPGNRYFYYLNKYENEIDVTIIDSIEVNNAESKKSKSSYHERDLHILLSTYLNVDGITTKTIFHEKSNSKDSNKKWIHPDMVGVKFTNLRSQSSKKLLKTVDKKEMFKLYSYELKKDIDSDYDLKKYYFQSVSNSSWANYGYLVASNISPNLYDEIERLNQSFGIGVIELSPLIFESQILFPAKFRSIDFKTTDKLCRINDDFSEFIDTIDKLLSVDDRFASSIENELKIMSDKILADDEINEYLIDKGIIEKDFFDPVEDKDV
jgi:hypothetical protein